MRHRAGKRHAPASEGFGQIVEALAAQIDPAAGAFQEAGQQQGQIVPAAASAADNGCVLVQIDREGRAVDGLGLAVFGIGEAGRVKRLAHRLRPGIVGQLQ